ncbi:MAG: cache domain-containing protein [Rhodospirillales bacterium]|nr:cache domain-containing protein [Rhodospirillales bacterium]MBO6787975.1 cache domain-containing protein [Rhodospirillales bacterium]
MISMNLSRRDTLRLLGAVTLAAAPLPVRAGDLPLGSVRDSVIRMVEDASAAVSEFGFPRALNRTEWNLWKRPELGLYVFVLDADGKLLLHPDRRGEGQNVIASHDTHGTPFIRNMIEAAVSAEGAGVWTRYQWADARSSERGTKHTYSKAAGGVIVSVGYVAAIS